MHPILYILAGVVAVAVAALVVAMIRGSAAIREFERRVAEIASSAGYAPFGPTEGRWLTFRSPTTYLRVVRGGHGATVDALLAARGPASRGEPEWVDDDLLRQVLLGEEGDPTGLNRVWTDWDAFASFLRQHLPRLAEAIGSGDPSIRAGIARAREVRNERWRRHLEEVRAEAARRRDAKRRK